MIAGVINDSIALSYYLTCSSVAVTGCSYKQVHQSKNLPNFEGS